MTTEEQERLTKVFEQLDLTIRDLTATIKGATASLQSAGRNAGANEEQPAIERRTPPQAPPPRQDFTGSWRDFPIPFGKQAGRTLGSLNPGSLVWWIENYQPKPYKGNPPRASDCAFRAALDAAKADSVGPGVAAPQCRSDLPLERETNLVNRDGTPPTDEDVPF